MPDKKRDGRKIAPDEVSVFCEQIALMLGAGLPVRDGLDALVENGDALPGDLLYQTLSQAVDDTGSLYEALKASGRFPAYMVEMTNIGEKTGKLEQVMVGLAAYYLRESKLRRAIVSAVAYPILLAVMMAAVIMVLIARVLPIFDQVLSGMGLSMDRTGLALMYFGMNAGKWVLVLVGVVIALVLTACLLLRTRHREPVMRVLRRVLPPIDRLNRKIAAARFAGVMAMMLDSGFPIEDALDVLPGVLPDPLSRASMASLREASERGEPFTDALLRSGFFEPLHARMIRMGALAGQTDRVMAKIAGIYEEEVDEGIGALVSVIEPCLVGLLAIVIGAVLLSVMLPMAGVISSIL